MASAACASKLHAFRSTTMPRLLWFNAMKCVDSPATQGPASLEGSPPGCLNFDDVGAHVAEHKRAVRASYES